MAKCSLFFFWIVTVLIYVDPLQTALYVKLRLFLNLFIHPLEAVKSLKQGCEEISNTFFHSHSIDRTLLVSLHESLSLI